MDRPIKSLTGSYLALFLLLAQIIFLFLVFRKLPPRVPLLYSRPWGEEQLVKTFWLFLIPFLSLIVTGLNLFIAGFLPKEEIFLKNVLNWAGAVFTFLGLVTLAQIARLVI